MGILHTFAYAPVRTRCHLYQSWPACPWLDPADKNSFSGMCMIYQRLPPSPHAVSKIELLSTCYQFIIHCHSHVWWCMICAEEKASSDILRCKQSLKLLVHCHQNFNIRCSPIGKVSFWEKLIHFFAYATLPLLLISEHENYIQSLPWMWL